MVVHDPIWMRSLLAVHVTAGVAGLVMAPMALATVKGGRAHRRWGNLYLWSMGVVAATAIPMALYRPVVFLAMVAVFSFYAAFAGYRVLRLKDLARGGSAKPLDWIAAGVTFADGALLALLGWLRPDIMRMPVAVPVIFGLLAMRLAYTQMRMFVRKPKDKFFWWETHLTYFLGSYIAMWSAFSVVTLSQVFGNAWYVWLWPTMVGVPCMFVAAAYFNRKLQARRGPVPA